MADFYEKCDETSGSTTEKANFLTREETDLHRGVSQLKCRQTTLIRAVPLVSLSYVMIHT
jgi:hypothetical protein